VYENRTKPTCGTETEPENREQGIGVREQRTENSKLRLNNWNEDLGTLN
jgi:hypothetical protein